VASFLSWLRREGWKDALPRRDRAAGQPAARFGDGRDRRGTTHLEHLIMSSRSTKATVRRWMGLRGHL